MSAGENSEQNESGPEYGLENRGGGERGYAEGGGQSESENPCRSRNGLQKFSGENRVERVGVDFDSGGQPGRGKREGGIERRGMTVIDLVIGSEEHRLSFEPLLKAGLISGMKSGYDVVKGDEGEGVGWPGVVDGEIAIGIGGDFAAGEKQAAAFEHDILAEKLSAARRAIERLS